MRLLLDRADFQPIPRMRINMKGTTTMYYTFLLP